MNIQIEKLTSEKYDGDWHDKPLRYAVKGPDAEIQQFSTKKNAELYRRIRLRSNSLNEAVNNYVKAAR